VGGFFDRFWHRFFVVFLVVALQHWIPAPFLVFLILCFFFGWLLATWQCCSAGSWDTHMLWRIEFEQDLLPLLPLKDIRCCCCMRLRG
jgi:hypothetical protein